jgi:hypothetical protein
MNESFGMTGRCLPVLDIFRKKERRYCNASHSRCPRPTRRLSSRACRVDVEEIAYATLKELIKIHRKKYYIIFFETWLTVDAPAECCFQLTSALLMLCKTRAYNASQRRDLTLGVESWISFYSLVCFSFLASYRRTVPLPFENAQVVNPCREHTFRFKLPLNWLLKPDF